MAFGDIGASNLDSLQFAAKAGTPKIVKVAKGIIAVFYYSSDSTTGIVQTYSVTSAGIISAVIDTKTFAATANEGDYADVIRVSASGVGSASNNFFAVVFRGYNSGYGTCKIITLSITSAGAISSNIDSLVIQDGSGSGYSCEVPHIIKVHGSVYAVVYYTSGAAVNWATIETISIDADGTDITAVDSHQLPNNTTFPRMYKVIGTTYLVAAVGTAMWTYTISDAGVITPTPLDTYTFGISITRPLILSIYDDVFAVLSYESSSNDGYIDTFTVSPSGTIAHVATKEWHTTRALYQDAVKVMRNGATRIIAISYQSDNSYGWVITYAIGFDGSIGASSIDNYRFLASAIYSTSLTHIIGSVYGVVVNYGVAGSGWLYTISIESSIAYPADAITRVTGLIHRYDRRSGLYTLEMSFGDVTSVMQLPYELTPKRATAEKQKEQDSPPVKKEDATGDWGNKSRPFWDIASVSSVFPPRALNPLVTYTVKEPDIPISSDKTTIEKPIFGGKRVPIDWGEIPDEKAK